MPPVQSAQGKVAAGARADPGSPPPREAEAEASCSPSENSDQSDSESSSHASGSEEASMAPLPATGELTTAELPLTEKGAVTARQPFQ